MLSPEAADAGPHAGFRSGFACFTGRPNVGKSTLTNALVGAKVAITSSRPQTTRRVIRGIVHRPDAQLVVVDTPGLHKPRTLLGERLDSLVRSTLTEVDVIGFCVPASEPIGPGDRYLARELAGIKGTPIVAIVTKTDQVTQDQLVAQLAAVAELGEWADVVPVSAVTGYNLDVLADVLVSRLPEGPPLYPEGELTDEPERDMVAELIREAALEGVREELPHSIAVVVEEMGPRPGSGRPHRRARRDVRRAAQPEGHRHRHQGEPAARTSAAAPASRSRRSWAPASTSTCTSRWPRTGSATPSSSAAWASTTDPLPPSADGPARRSAQPRRGEARPGFRSADMVGSSCCASCSSLAAAAGAVKARSLAAEYSRDRWPDRAGDPARSSAASTRSSIHHDSAADACARPAAGIQTFRTAAVHRGRRHPAAAERHALSSLHAFQGR